MGRRVQVFRLLEEVLRQGITHFDTARSYGRGFSEKLLGEFFRAHGGAFAVTTKFGVTYSKTDACPTAIALPLNWAVKKLKAAVGGGLGLRLGKAESEKLKAGKNPSTISDLPSSLTAKVGRDVVERSVEESLKQLGRERVEILLLHEMLPEQLTEEARGYLEGLRKAGTVGQLGCGTHRNVLEHNFREDPLVEVLQYEGSLTERPRLMEKFPGRVHIHHSLFRGVGRGRHGEALRRALELNPGGKVIFSTRSREHLRENLEGLG
jgi:aryl-alcohol dehydrogenase-like predicted oxidoreductase